MVNPQLLDYVNQQLRAGYDAQAIRAILQQSGYTPAMIDECFNYISSGSRPHEASQVTVTPAPSIGISGAINAMSNSRIKKRDLVSMLLLIMITFGVYMGYWFAKTKGEINSLGADIPTTWLLIVPIANLYWYYKYAEGFSISVKKDQSATPLWILLLLFVPLIAVILIQTELNKLA
jgi:hypothetical protein